MFIYFIHVSFYDCLCLFMCVFVYILSKNMVRNLGLFYCCEKTRRICWGTRHTREGHNATWKTWKGKSRPCNLTKCSCWTPPRPPPFPRMGYLFFFFCFYFLLLFSSFFFLNMYIHLLFLLFFLFYLYVIHAHARGWVVNIRRWIFYWGLIFIQILKSNQSSYK